MKSMENCHAELGSASTKLDFNRTLSCKETQKQVQGDNVNILCRLAAIFAMILSGVCLAACSANKQPAKLPDKLVLDRVEYSQLAGWSADNHAEAFASFLQSCNAIGRRSDDSATGKGVLELSTREWKAACAQAMQLNATAIDPALAAAGYNANAVTMEQARLFFESSFTPYRASNRGNAAGLFTGYYEPLLRGSLTQHDQYRYPVYAPPPDLVKGAPYQSRQQIEQGGLKNKALELAYVDNLADLFFLQVQGSGRLQMDDGTGWRLAYGGQNGFEYVALGKLMKDQGLLPPDGINMFTIKAWLNAHPAEAVTLMWQNPSYVFFTMTPLLPSDTAGPKGGQGVPLMAERSLAVDKNFYPYGLPIFLETTLPLETGAIPYQRLLIAQDTGGAIKGPVRGDVFYGFGDRAETLAGNMKQRGQWALLLPKALAARLGAHAE